MVGMVIGEEVVKQVQLVEKKRGYCLAIGGYSDRNGQWKLWPQCSWYGTQSV